MGGSKSHPSGKASKKVPGSPDPQHREQNRKNAKPATAGRKVSLFERTEILLDKHLNIVVWAVMLITLVFSLLLFDVRFSIAGDDSTYVVRSADFIAHFMYPGFSGPLYPIVLSPLVALFGINAVPLKSLSVLFILGFIFFTFKAFRGRISSLLLTSLLILLSINSFVLYYASQTYCEAFYMFIQAIAFYVFFTLFIAREQDKTLWQLIKHHLLLAACILALVLTRNIGLGAIIAVSAYFLVKSQWKNLLLFIIVFTVIFASFQGLKTLVWGSSDIHFTGQFENFISKNYYDTGGGREDLRGFVNRAAENSNFYLSEAFYTLLGFRGGQDSPDSYPVLTLLTWLLIISSTALSFRKNKYLLFTGLYAAILILATFLMTQTVWRQSRLIIPYFPLIVLMLLWLFFCLFNSVWLRKFQLFFFLFVLMIFWLEFRTTVAGISHARQIQGKYYGLTPDWENYCKVSAWASENLPVNAFVACRKPSISFIYGKGKRFFGITRINESPGNPMLQPEAQKKLQYYYVSTSSIEGHSVSNNIFYAFRIGLVGFGMINKDNLLSNPFYIMKFPDSLKDRTLQEMRKYNIKGTDNLDSLKTWLKDPEAAISFVYPDTLLTFLRKANVTHVITANLRADAAEKNGYTTSTVERFMALIRFKYPDVMTKIIQVGEDDNEPAVLYRINYDKTGLRFP